MVTCVRNIELNFQQQNFWGLERLWPRAQVLKVSCFLSALHPPGPPLKYLIPAHGKQPCLNPLFQKTEKIMLMFNL
jgi:hypothetical protein